MAEPIKILKAQQLLKDNGFDVYAAMPAFDLLNEKDLNFWRSKVVAWGVDIRHQQQAMIEKIEDEIERRNTDNK